MQKSLGITNADHSLCNACFHHATPLVYNHQIGSMTHLQLFRVRKSNDGKRCLPFYILILMTIVLFGFDVIGCDVITKNTPTQQLRRFFVCIWILVLWYIDYLSRVHQASKPEVRHKFGATPSSQYLHNNLVISGTPSKDGRLINQRLVHGPIWTVGLPLHISRAYCLRDVNNEVLKVDISIK